MDLLKKNIHMDRVRMEAANQITLEDDINLPENKPDVSTLNLEKGDILISSVRPCASSSFSRAFLTARLPEEVQPVPPQIRTCERIICFSSLIC